MFSVSMSSEVWFVFSVFGFSGVWAFAKYPATAEIFNVLRRLKFKGFPPTLLLQNAVKSFAEQDWWVRGTLHVGFAERYVWVCGGEGVGLQTLPGCLLANVLRNETGRFAAPSLWVRGTEQSGLQNAAFGFVLLGV